MTFVFQRKYEEEIDVKQKEIVKLENKVKVMSVEVKKGNEIIRKLQGDNKNYHAKVRISFTTFFFFFYFPLNMNDHTVYMFIHNETYSININVFMHLLLLLMYEYLMSFLV